MTRKTYKINTMRVSDLRAKRYVSILLELANDGQISWDKAQLLLAPYEWEDHVSMSVLLFLRKCSNSDGYNKDMPPQMKDQVSMVLGLDKAGFDAYFNARGIGATIETTADGDSFIGLQPSSSMDIPLALMAVLRCTQTTGGESWLDRICKCQECKRYFAKKTKKVSKFCSTKCRWRNYNARRKLD